jgi:hypothetical protein
MVMYRSIINQPCKSMKNWAPKHEFLELWCAHLSIFYTCTKLFLEHLNLLCFQTLEKLGCHHSPWELWGYRNLNQYSTTLDLSNYVLHYNLQLCTKLCLYVISQSFSSFQQLDFCQWRCINVVFFVILVFIFLV